LDAYEAIIKKRDRREYDGRPIPDDVLQRILQAGRMAGSSSNTQPLRLIVMRDPAAKQKLAPAGPGTAPLVNGPLGIVICLKRGSRDFDVGRAAQNMMVAAWAEGIHSCPIGLREEKVASEALGLPDDYVASIGISFGYPSGAASNREPGKRMPMEELVHYDRWGGSNK
jgi:nitroreductase